VAVPVRPRRRLQLSAQIHSASGESVGRSRSAEPQVRPHGDVALRKRPMRAASPHLTFMIGSDRRTATATPTQPTSGVYATVR